MTKEPDDRTVPGDIRFETVANASVDGLLVIDGDGIVQYSNPAANAMFAVQAGNLVGFHFGTPAVLQPTELQLPRKNEMRYVEMRASEFLWNDREATLASLRDITERKRAETYREMGWKILQILNEPDDLRESIPRVLASLKTLTGFDAVGLRLQEGEDYPYFVQDGFPENFLLTENTLVERGKDGGVCRDKDDKACLECTCGLVISGKTDPSNPLFTQGGSYWTNDSFPLLDLPSDQDPRLHPRNNCIHQGYASVALIPVRTKDRIVGLLQLNDKRKGRFTLETIQILEGIAAHVGSTLMRKRAEDARQKALDRVEAVFAALDDAIILVDVDTRQMIECNSAAAKIFGYNHEDIIGKDTAFLHVDQEHFEKFGRECLAAFADPGYYETEFEMRRKDGSVFPTEHFVRPVRDSNGQFVYLVKVVRDISNRKHLQAQLTQAHKMESIGRLAGGVAHDFNNLLMGIMGYVDLCIEEIATDHPIREWLDEIMHGAKRSSDLTRQLLAFARKQTIAPKVLDLNDEVAGILKMLHRLIGEDIDLLWKPGAELWPVKVDPSQVDQIMANLCVNARDAIGGVGNVIIETENASIDADYCKEHAEAVIGSYVMLAVSDDGCGMDKGTLAHLFEPFYTTKGVGEGTGLGLATVYGIVKQNAGFVNVNSEPGKGTTFRIYLPRFGGEHSNRKAAGTTEELPGGSETVMLVEDDKNVLAITKRFLKQLGYNVLTAETPSAALRLAAEHEDAIELLIVDVVMPGMNGRDLAAKLAQEYPRMKCLFISGYTADVIAHRGILDEGVNFMSKPFTRNDISRKVYEILKGKQTPSKE